MFQKFINNLLFFAAFIFGIVGTAVVVVLTFAYVTSTFGPFAGMVSAGVIIVVIAALIATYVERYD